MIEHPLPIIYTGEFQHIGAYLYDSLMWSGAGAGILKRDNAILEGKVCVNGSVVKDVGHILKNDDVVCILNTCYTVVK